MHLNTIRNMMAAISDANIVQMVGNVEAKMRETYGSMSPGQLYLLRQTLQRYFQGVKSVNWGLPWLMSPAPSAVLFHSKEGIQSSSDRLILPSSVTSPPCFDCSPAALPPCHHIRQASQSVTLPSRGHSVKQRPPHPALPQWQQCGDSGVHGRKRRGRVSREARHQAASGGSVRIARMYQHVGCACAGVGCTEFRPGWQLVLGMVAQPRRE